jgi:DHA2 family integral membrane protein (MFS transporter)
MGAVPEEKAGVASAMNDVTRQVAGALGVAVVGSLVSSLYATRVEDATTGLPPGAAHAAGNSVGAAVAVADRLPGPAGTALHHAAAGAYSDALGIGLLAAATAAFAGMLLVARFLPARHRIAGASPPSQPTGLAIAEIGASGGD